MTVSTWLFEIIYDTVIFLYKTSTCHYKSVKVISLSQFINSRRRYVAEILPTRRKTLYDQSINIHHNLLKADCSLTRQQEQGWSY